MSNTSHPVSSIPPNAYRIPSSLPSLFVILLTTLDSLTLTLTLQPLLPQPQPLPLQAVQFRDDLVALERYAVRLFRLGPEIGDGKAPVEVGAEIDCFLRGSRLVSWR